MTTTYVRQIVPSPATDDTILATHLNSEIDYLLASLNDFDASNCKKSGTSIPLANITNLTSTQMAAAFFKDEDDMASNSATAVSSQQAIKAYVDASSTDGWTPTSYAGEESITFPNGLIVKMGEESVAGDTVDTVTFGAAFPTAAINGQATLKLATTNDHESPHCLVSTTTIQIVNDRANTRTIYWQAWGY